MNRKERRAQKAKQKKLLKQAKDAPTAVEEKMTLFGMIPDECNTCKEPFDKTNKDMVMSWSVVVREREQKVNLYCPPCWEAALKVVEQAKNMIMEEE